MTGTQKRYSYPYDAPWADSGTMRGAFPSKSLSQPGGTVAMPRVNAPLIPSSGMPPVPALFQPAPTVPQNNWMPGQEVPGTSGTGAFAAVGGLQAMTMPSPYEAEYRQTGRGWEDLRNTLAANIQGLTSPQAWAHAGLPGSYWKGQTDEQMGALEQEISTARASIEARFSRGQINSAQRNLELERLERQAAERRASILSGTEASRREEGKASAQSSAQTLGALYGQVPVAAAPQQIQLSEVGGGGLPQLSGRGNAIDWENVAQVGMTRYPGKTFKQLDPTQKQSLRNYALGLE